MTISPADPARGLFADLLTHLGECGTCQHGQADECGKCTVICDCHPPAVQVHALTAVAQHLDAAADEAVLR